MWILWPRNSWHDHDAVPPCCAGRRQGLCCILLSIPLQFPRSLLAALVTKDKLQHVAAGKVCPKSRVRRSKKYKMKTQWNLCDLRWQILRPFSWSEGSCKPYVICRSGPSKHPRQNCLHTLVLGILLRDYTDYTHSYAGKLTISDLATKDEDAHNDRRVHPATPWHFLGKLTALRASQWWSLPFELPKSCRALPLNGLDPLQFQRDTLSTLPLYFWSSNCCPLILPHAMNVCIYLYIYIYIHIHYFSEGTWAVPNLAPAKTAMGSCFMLLSTFQSPLSRHIMWEHLLRTFDSRRYHPWGSWNKPCQYYPVRRNQQKNHCSLTTISDRDSLKPIKKTS